VTVTSNIYVGLAAWTNHTFVLGERCSNAGNAYQCITAGTSTAAPTGTSSNVVTSKAAAVVGTLELADRRVVVVENLATASIATWAPQH
jgi:hypothetical protein